MHVVVVIIIIIIKPIMIEYLSLLSDFYIPAARFLPVT